jgi:hypothetical protein
MVMCWDLAMRPLLEMQILKRWVPTILSQMETLMGEQE